MTQLSTKLGIMSLVLAFTIISLGDLYGADWRLLSKSKRGVYYYERETIERPLTDVVRVWVAFYPSEDVIPVFEILFGERYAALSYSYELVEVHCKKRIVRVISQECYSSDGAYIGSIYSRLPTPWRDIQKWDIGTSRVLETLCK